MLTELKHLHKLGLPLLWIRPLSKAPIEAGWTKQPTKSWDQLQAQYRPGYNAGVLLGRKLPDGTYLGVIDCDVKSTDSRHRAEMMERLTQLSIVAKAGPVVLSGRGNGSCHFYIRTRAPITPFRFAQSAEKVRVRIPSVEPTASERGKLSADELKQGFRLRAAWEISVMGAGQQVLVPPSVHPDSRKPYAWARYHQLGEAAIPLIDIQTPTKEKPNGQAPISNFKVVPYSLERVAPRVVDAIRQGTGVDDRSAALFGIAIALYRAGLNDAEIATCLTDESNFIGATAFEHAKTRDRARAAAWLTKFTLDKAKHAASAAGDFSDEYADPTPLTDEQWTKQCGDLLGERNWRFEIERTDKEGRAKVTLKNVILILQGEIGENVFVHNQFSGVDFYGCDTPWGGKAGAEVSDRDIIAIKTWFANRWRIEPSSDKLNEAVIQIGNQNVFHPVRDYLSALQWDGTARLDSWLRTYHHARGPEPYLSAVSRKVLVAMVARVYRPGCKFDQVLILEGKQGCGKSTAVRILASDEWFTDAYLDLKNKDAPLSLRSKWVLEMGELVGLTRADTETLKAFISTQADYIRVPYGRRHETWPRQCIFIGTTNNDEYLKDPTGNRRFWPVQVGDCDFETLARDRDQLMAEAVAMYQLGEPLYLEEKEAQAQSAQEQESRVFEDMWVDKIGEFLNNPNPNFPVKGFTVLDLFSDFGPLANCPHHKAEQMRAAQALRGLGFKKQRLRAEKSERKVLWAR